MTARPRSVVTRIVGSLFLFAVFITVLAGIFAYVRVSDSLRQSILDRLTISVALKEGELRRMLDQQREAVELFSRLPDLRRQAQLLVTPGSDRAAAHGVLAGILDRASIQHLGWREVLVLNLRGGKVEFSSEPGHEGDYRNADQFFLKGRQKTFIQNVYPWPATLQPTLTIATPLPDEAGQTVAVLAVHLSLDRMDEIVAAGGLGKSGDTYLVDRNNAFVSAKRFGTNEYPRGVHSEGVDAAILGRNGSGLYLNHAGEPVVGVYRWLPDLELALIAEVAQAEALAPARRLATTIGAAGLFGAALCMVGLYFLARRIARPILAIKDTAVAVANGDLDAVAPVLSTDEVGILARSFNEMTARLRTTLSGLERELAERQRLEEDKIAMERKLLHTQKLESLGVLAGGVAHDFNNLLMAMLGNLDIALLSLPEGAPARKSLERAEQAAQRAADLTRQMLAYSGKGKFVVEEIQLADLVSESAQLLRTSIPRTIEFHLQLDRTIPRIKADPGQIGQVVMNLITNAAEAIGEQPGTITLATGCCRLSAEELLSSRLDQFPPPGEFSWIDVQDSGCGMDEATSKRIFEPFFTTKFTGRGLGMSAVLGILRGHQGAIFLDSEPGRGTRMRVFFPALATGQGLPAAHERPPAAALPGQGTILVVDDEEMVREICRDLVQSLGLQVLTAVDGEDALRIAADPAQEITCVILDLTMPRMNGTRAFERLRQIRPGLPIVLSSGYNEQSSIQQFTAQGLSGFIQKPYTLELIRETLAQVLSREG